MPTIYEMINVPSAADYVRALTALGDRVSDEHRLLFRTHYHAPDRTATSKQLANWAGIEGGWAIVNSRYGKLSHAVCDYLEIKPQLRPDDTYRWWSLWSRGWSTPGGFVWQMLPRFAEVLEQLGWVNPDSFVLPDEVTPSGQLLEGARCRVTVNAYERSSEARRICIEAHGVCCAVCEFKFGEYYGAEAEGYIHVHHIRPLSEIGREYQVDPVKDLRPVCPNCHAFIHLGGRCRSIEDVRQVLRRRGSA